MILPDVNILLYAFRTDCAEHLPNKKWLETVVGDPAPYGMAPQAINSVVRIATNRRAFERPYALNDVLAFCTALQDQPHCHLLHPGPRHWGIFCDLCHHANATGNLVQDAWFAALAIENGCEWITHDRDYAKFPGLRWRPPF